jgi:HEAT repeat protein
MQFGAQYPEERKRAIPEMRTLLNDPDRDVRMSVTNELNELDPRTAVRAGVK